MPEPFLFVGLDLENPYSVAELAEELNQVNSDRFGYKLNLDFFINSAIFGETEPMKRIAKLDRPIFADLKMWNGRRTMSSIAGLLHSAIGANYVDVHSLAGEDFIKAVVEQANKSNIKVLVNTVLTHYDSNYTQRMRNCSLAEAVRIDGETAYRSGAHGITVAGTMLGEVIDLNMEKLVPAVRPDWYGKTGANYQKQETSIREAIDGGANLLVCSSPIRKAEDRKSALVKTLAEMN